EGHKNARPRVAVLGLAFKPDVDDLRESPALYIAENLAVLDNAELIVSEPNIETLPLHLSAFRNVRLSTDDTATIATADIVVMLVNHKQYYDVAAAALKGKVIIDTRGIWA